jgi:filamentous hemagglutinin family protein
MNRRCDSTSTFPRPRARAVALAVASALAGGAWANPSGPSVAAGSATFSASGNTLNITNTPGTIINWQQFSIRPDEITRFIQSGAMSAVLNRVTGHEHSQLLGQLLSNGRVFLINPNGITIGQGALIDTAGFVASSLNISDADFLSGRMRFQALAGEPGKVVNQGTINASSGGQVYLIAPSVENHGVITAPNGDVLLAAGKSVEVVSSASPHIRVELNAPANGEALNVGQVVGGRIGIYGGLVRNAGALNASSVTVAENGNIILKASGDVRLEGGTVRAGAVDGGVIRIEGDRVIQGGVVDASGARGGDVAIAANTVLQSARVDAVGTTGAGGRIDVRSAGSLMQTADTVLDASGAAAGGAVTVQATGARRVFSSATIAAGSSAGAGGTVKMLGNDIVLAGAQIDASGGTGGGKVMVGGDFHGANADVPNAQAVKTTVGTAIAADARVTGSGGDVVVWADGATRFAGSITARGGAQGGDGGRVEVSGKASVQVAGQVDASAPNGRAGTFIIDPKNIVIQATAPSGTPAYELDDPNPGAGENFGASYQVIGGNWAVVTDPLDQGGIGAAYVFDVSANAPAPRLRSTITGSVAGDNVGDGGITPLLGSQGFIVASTAFNNGAGAMTFGSAASFTNGGGVVGAGNSLAGSSPGEGVGNATVDQLVSNLRFALVNPGWNGGVGAVTFGDAASGMPVGFVSAANSITGAVAGDQVGSGGLLSVGPTANEAVVIASPNWNNGRGAVQWVDMSLPTTTTNRVMVPIAAATGVLTSANVVGGQPGDAIGSGGMERLANGNLVISSPDWSDGTRHGASTWMNGATGLITNGTVGTDTVTAANSLTGDAPGAFFGQSVTPLSNGNYVLMTPNAFNGGGAATLVAGAAGGGGSPIVNGATQAVGGIDGSNSLLGGGPGAFGSATVQELFNAGVGVAYAVMTPGWGGNRGAVTISPVGGAGAGPIGAIDASKSLVGTTPGGSFDGDRVGSAGSLFEIGNGKYVLSTPDWTNTATSAARAGALTYIDSAAPPIGPVSGLNSVVGTAIDDRVGSGTNDADIVALSNGWYAFHSPSWGGGRGAVTFFNAANAGGRLQGSLGAANSLVGGAAGDQVGTFDCDGTCNAITDMGNGTFVVASPGWTNAVASASRAGAVTLVDPVAGSNTGPRSDGTGVVGVNNSIYGTQADDAVGGSFLTFGGGVYRLDANTFAISSPDWSSASVGNVGALTFGTVSGWAAGAVTTSNSLHGTSTGDRIGSDGLYDVPSAAPGTFALASSRWNTDAGAVTFFDVANLPTGQAVSGSNSVIGQQTGDVIGSNGVVDVGGANALILSPNWDGGRGAATLVNANLAKSGGVVTATNSFTGAVSGDAVGASGVELLANGNFVLRSNANGRDAYTFMTATAARAGETLSAGNSLIGGTGPGESLGSDFRELASGDYIVVNPTYGQTSPGTGRGMIVFGSKDTGVVGTPSAAIGWVGTAVGERLGQNVRLLDADRFVFNAPGATKGAFPGAGRLFIANPSGLGGVAFGGTLLFNDPGSDPNPTILAASQIASILNSGTAVLLQAGNDITVNAAIDASGTTIANGSLTMQAGRSILVNESITNLNRDGNNRSIALIANDPAAPAGQRDPGLGELRVAPGKSITGGGDVLLSVLDATGAGISPGGMTVGNVAGENVELYNSDINFPQFAAARFIQIAPGSVVTATNRFALVADGDARFGTPGGAGATVQGITSTTDVVAFGALVGGSGTLIDASASTSPVNLSAQSIGAPGQPFGLLHGSQGVDALATTGGIHLAQTAGTLTTGFWFLDALPAQQVSLGALGGVMNVDGLNVVNANPLRLHTSGSSIVFANPGATIAPALLQLDAGTGLIEVTNGVTFGTPLQASSFLSLQGGTTTFNGPATLNGLGVIGAGTTLNIGAGPVSTTALSWGNVFTQENNAITGSAGSTLTVTGSGGATISGDGIRSLNSVELVLNPAAASLYTAALAGGGAIHLLGTARIVNNGNFTISNDNPIAAPTTSLNVFDNGGSLNKLGGTGTTVIGGPVGQVIFNNTGTLRVSSGRIALASGSMLGGNVVVESVAGLDLTGGPAHTSTGAISGPGMLTIANTTLTADAPITTALTAVGTGGVLTANNAMAGQLDVAGTANLNGAATLTGLNVTAGTLNINAASTVTTNAFTQIGGAVQGTGSLSVLSSFTRSGGGTFAGNFSNLDINQAVGNLDAGGLDAVTSLKLAAPGGTLTLPTAITVSGMAKLAGNAIALNGDVSAGAIELVSPNVQLGTVTLTGPVNAAGASLFLPDGNAATFAGGGASAVRDLTVGGNGTSLVLTGPTTVTGSFLWQGASGASTISGGALAVNGNAAIGGDGTHVLDNVQLVNNGNMIFGPTFGAGGPLLIQNGATLTNNGTLNLQNDQPIRNDATATIGTLRNVGTLLKTATPAGITQLGGGAGTFVFDNDGQVLINAGTLSIAEPGSGAAQTGTFAMAPTGGLNFSSGTHVLNGSITGGTLGISNTADVTVAGALTTNVMQIGGGTLAVNGSANTSLYNQTGGVVGGTGNLAVGSSFAQSGGTLGNTFNTLSITQASGDIEGSGFGATGSLALAAPTGAVNISNPLSLAGNASFFGGTGINVTAPVSAASMGMVSGGTARISNATVQAASGAISISAAQVEIVSTSAPAGLLAASGLNVVSLGDVILQGGSAAGAHAELNSGTGPLGMSVQRNLKLTGGSGADAYALVMGDPHVGSTAAPIRIGGVIEMQSGSGTGATARIESVSPTSIHVLFPNASSGGYMVNGLDATSASGSGFFAGGQPAILGQNLFIEYGVPSGSPVDSAVVLSALDRSTQLLGNQTDDQRRRRLQELFDDIDDAPVCK